MVQLIAASSTPRVCPWALPVVGFSVELRGFEPMTFSLRRLGAGVRLHWLRVDQVQGVPVDSPRRERGVRRESAHQMRPTGRRPSSLGRQARRALTLADLPSRIGGWDRGFAVPSR